jgi:hypothetical protein
MAKKYSIIVEKDKVIAVEVNGARYETVDEIPDDEDRGKMMFLVSNFEDLSDFSDMESGAPGHMPATMSKIILLVFLVVTLLMLAIAVVSAVSTSRVLAREETAPGKVVDVVGRIDSQGKEFYYPVVEFYLPNAGRRAVEISEGSRPAAYDAGDIVTVAYDPEQPGDARIKSTASAIGQWVITIITGALGLAFLIATLFAGWMLRQELAPAPSG